MRYFPLSDADRGEMLGVIGAGSMNRLFRDVPEGAPGLPEQLEGKIYRRTPPKWRSNAT